MPNHELPKMLDELKSQATTEMRKVEKTDDVSADFINPIFKQFLINDQYAFEQMKAIMAMNFVNHLLKTKEKNLLEAVNELYDKIKSNTDLLATKSDTGHTHEQYLEKTSDITGTGDLYSRTQVDALIRQLQEKGLTQEQVQGMITAAIILQKIKTVDGIGSGLDADLLDGLHASDFLRTNGKAMDSHKLEGHPSSYFATAQQLQQVFQSVADGKSTLISAIDQQLGYQSGLSTQSTWNDILYFFEKTIDKKSLSAFEILMKNTQDFDISKIKNVKSENVGSHSGDSKTYTKNDKIIVLDIPKAIFGLWKKQAVVDFTITNVKNVSVLIPTPSVSDGGVGLVKYRYQNGNIITKHKHSFGIDSFGSNGGDRQSNVGFIILNPLGDNITVEIKILETYENNTMLVLHSGEGLV